MSVQKKILLLGDGAVGKTSLVHRFVEGVFKDQYKATIGVDIFSKKVETSAGEVELQVWDLSGQSHFAAVRGKFYSKAEGALLVFDLTNADSFSNLEGWIKEVENASGVIIPMFVLGNKNDLAHLKAVEDDAIASFAGGRNWKWSTSSAKTGENVEEAFQGIAETVVGV